MKNKSKEMTREEKVSYLAARIETEAKRLSKGCSPIMEANYLRMIDEYISLLKEIIV